VQRSKARDLGAAFSRKRHRDLHERLRADARDGRGIRGIRGIGGKRVAIHDGHGWKEEGCSFERSPGSKSLSDSVHGKLSLPRSQAFATMRSSNVDLPVSRVSNITVNRRRNALALFQHFAEAAVAGGAAPKGLEQAFAARIEVSPSMWSQVKSSRPIGDRLARQIEQHCGKPSGWLDEEREPEGLSAAEQQFLALALKAWRGTNSDGRKKLREQLRGVVAGH
jgi:hypothetical protein